MRITEEHISVFKSWQQDWNKFAREVLHVNLDLEQQKILQGVQTERMISVCSGTSRGKDFIAAVAGNDVVAPVAGAVYICAADQDKVFEVGCQRVADTRLHGIGSFAAVFHN